MQSSFSGLFTWSLFWATTLLLASWHIGRYFVADKVTYGQVEIRSGGAILILMAWLWYGFKAATNQDWLIPEHLSVVGASFALFLTATWSKWWRVEKQQRPPRPKRAAALPKVLPLGPLPMYLFQQ